MLDKLIDTDPETLDGPALARHVAALDAATSQCEAARSAALARFEALEAYRDEGALNAAGWLRCHRGTRAARARAQVRVARRLRDMPATTEALAAGEISHDKAALLAEARTPRLAEAFSRDEHILVDAARRLACDELGNVIKHWRNAADPDGASKEQADQWNRRRAGLVRGYDGTWHLSGNLDPESGAIISGIWQAIIDELRRADAADDEAPERSATQRNVDALVELARRAGACDISSSRPPRPEMVALTDIEDLFGTPRPGDEAYDSDWDDPADPNDDEATGQEDRAGADGNDPATHEPMGEATTQDWVADDRRHGSVELIDGTVLPGEVARRLACDASLRRAVVSGASEIIDMGRATPVPNAAQRSGLLVRDGGCIWPGCDRPATWCDAHHLEPYRRGEDIGGDTDLDELGLLCRRHHRLVHEGGFAIGRDPTTGEVELTRPQPRPTIFDAPTGPIARRRAVTHPDATNRHRKRRRQAAEIERMDRLARQRAYALIAS